MKKVVWLGDSNKVVSQFGASVRRVLGFQLHLLQEGKDPYDWKPMQSIGAGVREIRVKVGDQYRIIYLAKFDREVYVLHAFKKSRKKLLRKIYE